MNNYEAALQAMVADPDLQAALSAASTPAELGAALTDAGLMIPTQSDVDAYNDDPDLTVEGAGGLSCEAYWIGD
jgi:hypothetical protein